MNLHCDLHSHSTVSDGTLTPVEMVLRAYEKGVEVFALTDHDATEGLKEAAQTADKVGLQFVPGIEISVTWSHQTIHIVGLGINPDDEALNQGLKVLREFRGRRGEEIALKLEKKGLENPLVGAKKFANGEILSRTHFARYLVEQGRAKDIRQVFKRFLVKGKPGYVAGKWASLEDALSWIQGAGGIAVIAHPARYKISATRLRQLITEFKELGGLGFEAISGSHSPDEEIRMAQLANQFDLFISKGSDFHSPENIYRELGAMQDVPAGSIPLWHSDAWKEKIGLQKSSDLS
ncbi:MAG: PHP domain-containing protein [Gammaproteobacteria bacterium]|nr:PHP domain-containing protein [Gammaproteobacteria bacterium]